MSDQRVRSPIIVRRRSRVIGFIIAEALAIALLLVVGSLAVSSPSTNSSFASVLNIITIAAGAAVAILPIAFFAIAPVLPPGEG